ncbi:MAG TPA: hypothetical protein VGA67_00350 [Candidatus Dojkabacteria bacterium]
MRKLSIIFVFTPLLSSLFLILSFTRVTAQDGTNVNNVPVGSTIGLVHSFNGIIGGCYNAGHVVQSSGQLNLYNPGEPCPTLEQLNAEGKQDTLEYQILSAYAASKTPTGKILGYTSLMYDEKPSSAIAWFDDNIDKIQGDNKALADVTDFTEGTTYRPGTGFAILAPLQGLWAWSRNLTYILFIIIIIIISFLILFRKNLGGQTPVNLFSAIPGIILSLVLITFSYPISGLFIDVITLGSNLMQNLILSGPGAPGAAIWQVGQGTWIASGYPDGAVESNRTVEMIQPDDPAISIWNGLGTSGFDPCQTNSSGETACDVNNLLPEDAFQGNLIGQLAKSLVDVIDFLGADNALIQLVIGVAVLMVSIKLFMSLLNKYVLLVLMVVLAPWYFFLSAFPNRTGPMLALFIKTHLGAALGFVSVYGMFLFMIVLGQSDVLNDFNWAPPLLGYSQSFINENPGVIRSLVILGVYLSIPAMPQFINTLLEVPENNVFAREIGGSVKGGVGLVGQGISSIGAATGLSGRLTGQRR